jgi:hypothetical protein
MRITAKRTFGQLFLLLGLFALCECTAKKDENSVVPPPTSPLSGVYVGFGVITASFTHVMAEPDENSSSLGYLRRGSLVRILKRQLVKTGDNFVSWVLTEENQGEPAVNEPVVRGWLKEEVMEIYDSESRAKTAANQKFEETRIR